MERLTERNKNGLAMAACCGKACEYNYCCEVGGFSDCKGIDDIIDRLADIEDILGDTYDLDHLRELVEADKAGRCVVLPCKVGDKVYVISFGKIREHQIISIPFLLSKSVNHICFHAENYRQAVITLELEDFGKTVFGTREEAEAALRKSENETNE